MPHTDLHGSALLEYRSATVPPRDLASFWQRTLTEARDAARPATLERVDTGLALVETWDVSFTGFGGDPVRAWYHRPADTTDDLPIVVRFQGYGGGRGLSHQVHPLALTGYAMLEVDTRGQGSGWAPGDTPDPAGSGPAHPGYLTRGVLDPEQYYYRRVFTDGVRAVDTARALAGVDRDQVVVCGGSQGGGISLAVAALEPSVAGVMADVPFLSDFRRAVQICNTNPYLELTTYLSVHRDRVDQVFATLSYFDVSVLGRLASAPALMSVALMDELCPPSTVYAAYHAYAGPKELRVYPYNNHEGGVAFQEREQLNWLRQLLTATASARTKVSTSERRAG
jgi:cephalosporin-C deacetylase